MIRANGKRDHKKIRIKIKIIICIRRPGWYNNENDPDIGVTTCGVIGRIVLLCVWVFHLVYFTFGVKTFQGESTEKRPE